MSSWASRRKAIAAGVGVVVTGVLEFVISTPAIATDLEHVMPAPLVPLVPIVFGGIATVLGVHQASNDDGSTAATVAASTRPASTPAAAAVASPPVVRKTTTAAAAPARVDAPAWWPAAATPATAGAGETSVIKLDPLPTISPL